jgi:hypothetical protein
MKKLNFIMTACGILIMLLLTAGCGNIIQPDRFTSLDDGIRSLDYLEQPEPYGPIIEGPIPEGDPDHPDRPSDLEGYYNSVYKYDTAEGYNEGICLDPTSDLMWPGSLIDANTIHTGEYRPIAVERGPVTISISIAGVPLSYVEIPEANLASVRQGISTLVNQEVTGTVPANVTFFKKQVHSEEHLKLGLGAHFHGMGYKFKSMFEFSNDQIRTHVLVRFMQVYYTIDVNHPNEPSDFLAESVTWKELKDKIGSNACPVYVASVTYGRMAMISIKSSYSASEVEAAAKFAYDGIAAGGGAEWEIHCRNVLNESTIEARIYGGDANAAASVAISGFDGFKDWIEADGELTTVPIGAPLSYKLRYLGDNSVTDVVLASEFYVRNTVKINDKFRVTILELENMSDTTTKFRGDIVVYAGHEGQNDETNDLVAQYETCWLNYYQKYPIQQYIDYDFDANNLGNAYIRIKHSGNALIAIGIGSWSDNVTVNRTIKIQDLIESIANGTQGDDINGRYYINTIYDIPLPLHYESETRLHFIIEPIE